MLILTIITSPVLAAPDPDWQFILEVDTSQYATRAILFQIDTTRTDTWNQSILWACGYHSKMFNATEQQYPIYNHEYLAMLHGLWHWAYLLKVTTHPVIVLTNHRNLLFYQEPHKLSNRVMGWVNEMSQYNLKIVYKPGATNHTNALSRRPNYTMNTSIDNPIIALPSNLFITPDTLAHIPVVEISQPHHLQIAEVSNHILESNLETSIISAQHEQPQMIQKWHQAHGLEQRKDLWWKGNALVVVENDDLRRGVIALFHDPPTAGHPGITKTTTLLTKYYWWPRMRDTVTQYVKGCTQCQMTKVNTVPTKPPLYPINPKHSLPFETVAMDFIVKLPSSDGYDSILTITNHNCTKASIFIPCNKSTDAPGLARLYATNVFPHYGIPRKIISDRGPQLISKFIKELCILLEIKQNISTAYHPQMDGQSEHTNQSLEQYLRLYCGTWQDTWAKWLPMAQYVKNSWAHSITKKTPFDLLIGYTPKAHQPDKTTLQRDIVSCIERVKQAREEARQAMTRAQS